MNVGAYFQKYLTLAHEKFREINVGYSNHNLGIVLVKKYFEVALEWKPVHSLFIKWYYGHMTHTRAHTNLFAGTDRR